MKKRIENILDTTFVKGVRLVRGETVRACLYDNQVVEGEIVGIFETTLGTQIRIVNGDFVWNVGANRVERKRR